ncbi:MAG: hypothetical protein H6741_12320 [Alphaproteobacteria bacterium]|nr:hypothetical protein [Alphaproteobacteria bacterium]MCB9793499.1 hypothetical protein [Alphaproteobacteria bacterium]
MIAATLLALACTGGDATPPEPSPGRATPESSISIVYTNNVHGEIEPCG